MGRRWMGCNHTMMKDEHDVKAESRVKGRNVLLYISPRQELGVQRILRVPAFGPYAVGDELRRDGAVLRVTKITIRAWPIASTALVTVHARAADGSDDRAHGVHFRYRRTDADWIEFERRDIRGLPADGSCPCCFQHDAYIANLACGNRHGCCVDCCGMLGEVAACPLCREPLAADPLPAIFRRNGRGYEYAGHYGVVVSLARGAGPQGIQFRELGAGCD